MTQIAFYAPLKSPLHAVPSGDRAMARALILALNAGGLTTELVSELRSFDRTGDSHLQRAIKNKAEREIKRVLEQAAHKDWRAWVTYHNYYKAPDLIGPVVSKSLGLPYIQIESTRAHKRLTGPWADFAKRTEAACDQADAIFHLTEYDRESLIKHQANGQRIVHLSPFLAQNTLPPIPSEPRQDSTLLCVGMMRPGDKLKSYRIVAEILPWLKSPDWTLRIAGDGPARTEIENLLAPVKDRVHFLGELDARSLTAEYQAATLLFWPGVNEAFGMVYLEAQATGLPVVAQNRNGVRDVVQGGVLCDPDTPKSAADAIDRLLNDPAERRHLGRIARKSVKENHLIGPASRILAKTIRPLIGERP